MAVETLTTPFLGTKAMRVVTTGGAAGAGHSQSGTANMAVVAASTLYAFSGWIYSPTGGETVGIVPESFTAAGAYIASHTASNKVLAAGWNRITGTCTTSVGAERLALQYRTTGTISSSLLVKAFQVEQQPIVTPYVPTDGATATRPAARVQAPATLLDETQGWVAMRVRVGWPATVSGLYGGTTTRFFDWTQDANNRIIVYFQEGSDTFAVQRRSGAGAQSRGTSAQTFAAGDVLTLVAAWTATQVKISVNGGAFSADSGSVFIPTLPDTLFDVGGGASGEVPDSSYLWFACGKGTLSDLDAARLGAMASKSPWNFVGSEAKMTGCFPRPGYTLLQPPILV